MDLEISVEKNLAFLLTSAACAIAGLVWLLQPGNRRNREQLLILHFNGYLQLLFLLF